MHSSPARKKLGHVPSPFHAEDLGRLPEGTGRSLSPSCVQVPHAQGLAKTNTRYVLRPRAGRSRRMSPQIPVTSELSKSPHGLVMAKPLCRAGPSAGLQDAPRSGRPRSLFPHRARLRRHLGWPAVRSGRTRAFGHALERLMTSHRTLVNQSPSRPRDEPLDDLAHSSTRPTSSRTGVSTGSTAMTPTSTPRPERICSAVCRRTQAVPAGSSWSICC